jgi:hypothetical protein
MGMKSPELSGDCFFSFVYLEETVVVILLILVIVVVGRTNSRAIPQKSVDSCCI